MPRPPCTKHVETGRNRFGRCLGCRRDQRRRWRQRNPEKNLEQNKRWYWADPSYKRMKSIAQNHGCLPDLLQQVLERDGHMCQNCWKREDLSFDHVLPVSKGGQTEFWNLQVLCVSCNASKGNRTEKVLNNQQILEVGQTFVGRTLRKGKEKNNGY